MSNDEINIPIPFSKRLLNVICLFRLLGQHRGESADYPILDPCLPSDLQDEVGTSGQKLFLRGTGHFEQCRLQLQPFLNRTNETHSSLNGVYQAPINVSNSQFYGFSEFYYCTEDVLRMGGDYNSTKYANAAKVGALNGKHMHEERRFVSLLGI